VVRGEEGSYDEGSEFWIVRAFTDEAAAEALAGALVRLVARVQLYSLNRPIEDRRARMVFWTPQPPEELAMRAEFEHLDRTTSSDRLRNYSFLAYSVEPVELEEAQ
jgi:hypothetical protein